MKFLFTFFLGAIIGSFGNVLILRIPKNEDFIFKSSHCPYCLEKIKWFHNIPVFSYLFLKGKCAFCKHKISYQYPLFEAFNGFFYVYLSFEISNLESLKYYIPLALSFTLLSCLFLIDLRHKILPDILNIALAIIFLFLAIVTNRFGQAILGFLVGFIFPLGVTFAFYKLKGVVGMGGGDIKLYGVLGLYLGPIVILQNIFLSCLIGSLVALVGLGLKKIDKSTPIPFGPFIIIVAIMQIYFAEILEQKFWVLF